MFNKGVLWLYSSYFVHSIRLVLLFEFLWNLFFLSAIPFCLCCFENGFVFFGVFLGALLVQLCRRYLVMMGVGGDRKYGKSSVF